MKIVKIIISHLLIVLGAMFLTFTVLNHFNDAMNFINNEISITLMFIWAVLSLTMGIILVAENLRSSGSNDKPSNTIDDNDVPAKPTGAQRYKKNVQ